MDLSSLQAKHKLMNVDEFGQLLFLCRHAAPDVFAAW
jgi:hypothetical protein